MISCHFNKCEYPACDRTCGLDEPGIIAMLQKQIEVLDTYRRNMNLGLLEIRHLEEYLGQLQQEGYRDEFNYYEECPYDDCILNPMEMKQWRPEYWRKKDALIVVLILLTNLIPQALVNGTAHTMMTKINNCATVIVNSLTFFTTFPNG